MIRWIRLPISGHLESLYYSSNPLKVEGWMSSFIPRENLDSLNSFQCEEGILWIDLRAPTPDELKRVGDTFQLHPLAIEDCLHADQRPKVEDYAGHFFVVLHSFETPRQSSLTHVYPNGIPDNDSIESHLRELHIFLKPGLVITVHDGSVLAIEELLVRCTQDRTHLTPSSDFLLQKILEEVVDGQPRFLEYLDDSIQSLDEEVLQEKDPARSLEKVHALQNRLNFMRRILVPQREVFQKLHAERFSQISIEALPWYRDLLDHAIRIQADMEELRENLWTIREAHLAIAAHRTNEAMRRLTIFSVVFLPLTFITGFFGMNFQSIPYHRHEFLWATVLLVSVLPVLMLFWFSKRRWL